MNMVAEFNRSLPDSERVRMGSSFFGRSRNVSEESVSAEIPQLEKKKVVDNNTQSSEVCDRRIDFEQKPSWHFKSAKNCSRHVVTGNDVL